MSEDFPAFIVNRILLPMINEAIYTLYEGVGNVEAIDTAMKLGYGHPMGPLELTDLVGLDVRLGIADYLSDAIGPAFEPPGLLRRLVAEGKLGRKSGEGFYRWQGDKPAGEGRRSSELVRRNGVSEIARRK